MTRYINLKLTDLGVDVGPFFDIYLDDDNFTNPVRQNVSVLSLSAGYILEVNQPTVTEVRVKSTGICTNYVDKVIPCVSTP